MHESVQDRLEKYFSGTLSPEQKQEFNRHLSQCEACRIEVDGMSSQNAMLHLLRPPAGGIDPAPGFYARVLARIESQSRNSIWNLFLEPAFARRLLYSSLFLFILLGSLILTTPRKQVVAVYTPEGILSREEFPPAYSEDVSQGRDVVLVNLATYAGE